MREPAGVEGPHQPLPALFGRLTIQIRWYAEQRDGVLSGALPDVTAVLINRFDVPHLRAEHAMAAVPSPVVILRHAACRYRRTRDEGGNVQPLFAGTPAAHQQLVILHGTDAVLDALQFGREESDGIEQRPAHCEIRADQAQLPFCSHMKRLRSIVHECQGRPVRVGQPGPRGHLPLGQHFAADEVDFRVLVE